MEINIRNWKLSIKLTKTSTPLRRHRKKVIGRQEQIQWISILQNEERKAADYPFVILGAGLTMCVIVLTIILLLQGALGQAATIMPNMTTTNTIGTANIIAGQDTLKVQNIVITFQAVLSLFLGLMILVLIAQIISGIYNKRVKALRNYLLERYKFDEDIKGLIMHITKDVR